MQPAIGRVPFLDLDRRPNDSAAGVARAQAIDAVVAVESAAGTVLVEGRRPVDARRVGPRVDLIADLARDDRAQMA